MTWWFPLEVYFFWPQQVITLSFPCPYAPSEVIPRITKPQRSALFRWGFVTFGGNTPTTLHLAGVDVQ